MDLAYLKEIGVASYGQDDQQLPTAVELCSITLTADKSASLKAESGESDQVVTQVMNDTAIAEKKNRNLAGSKIELTALEAPTLLVSLAKKEFLATAAPPPDQSKMRLKETNAVDTAQMSLELPPHSDHDNGSGSLYSKDTCGATLEEKANGSGDVRTDLQEALATSVSVASEPYDPPRLIRDAPINQDVKGGKGEKGEQEKGDRKGKGSNATGNVDKDAVVAEALLNLKGGKGEKEKGGGKGKGSNATGNVANDTVVAEAPLNLDVKGGKGEKEKGGGKGRAKGKGKKGGKDSAGKGNWDRHGKGKAKGKGKKDSNGHGKGANGPEHQQVMPETQLAKGKGKKGSKSKGANDAGHQNFKGGKGYRNKGHVKGNAKGKGKKGGKNFQAKGVWDKGYGKGCPKGNKGYGKGKGKKGLEQNIYM